MEINELKRNWELLGQSDPFWAILSVPQLKGGKWNVDEFFETGVTFVERIISEADALKIELPSGVAIDFGCGVGRITQALAKHFDKVYGIDVSQPMIEQANEFNKMGAKCEYVLNAKDDLSQFEDASVNFCITFLVLQHMRTDYAQKYIAELCRITKPGGVVVFQVPSHVNQRVIDRDSAVSLPKPTAKSIIKGMLPKGLLKPVAEPPAPSTEGIIEMHGTSIEQVVALLRAHSMQIVSIKADVAAGPEFYSYTYWSVKD